MRQLQSAALRSGPSILSSTSWLFKRAKAQRCSFLNTQIRPGTYRGTAVWLKSPSLSLSPSLPTLDFDTPLPSSSHYPSLLHRPHYTLLLSPPSLSFPPTLLVLSLNIVTPSPFPTLASSISHLTPSRSPPLFNIRPIYLHLGDSESLHPALHSYCAIPLLHVCCISDPVSISACLALRVEWLMPRLGSWPSCPTTHADISHWTRRGCFYFRKGCWRLAVVVVGGFGEQAMPTPVPMCDGRQAWGGWGGGGRLAGSLSWYAVPHYGSVGTVLRGIHCVAVELITPVSHGAQGTQRQQDSLQR